MPQTAKVPATADTPKSIREIRKLLAAIDVQRSLAEHRNQALVGLTLEETSETASYRVTRTVQDGIERVVYTPKLRRFETPILMQHGMWHAAWCWQPWQELLATHGWESIAVSLPGHGASPEQRPLAQCTLDYYLGFLRAEVDRLPTRPVLMGHSMGGALTQWYLKHVGDLPAAVLVASWLSHDVSGNSPLKIVARDPWGFVLMGRAGTATPLVRNARRAASMFITAGALLSPEELHARLDGESRLVLLQHHAPLWSPRIDVKTPLLWVSAGRDSLISAKGAEQAAKFYGASYLEVPDAGHDVMLECSSADTAARIQAWLENLRLK